MSIDEAEPLCAQILALQLPPEETGRILWGLACECAAKRLPSAVRTYGEVALEVESNPKSPAAGALLLGSLLERAGDSVSAASTYSRALDLPESKREIKYFLNNNLGYGLHRVGQFSEAEGYCRIALAIDPSRHNAYKNLGIALEGLGRHAEALASYLTATELFPADPRALQFARGLLTKFPFLAEETGSEAAEKARRLGAARDDSVN